MTFVDEMSPLAEALQRRTLVPFVGADLPREVNGLPSRADLARELARRKGLDESLPLAEVAQRVGQAGNRWEFTDFIRVTLDTTGKSPQPFHQRVVSLVEEHQLETIITTAYDNLLELAFQGAGLGINRVVRGGDVSFINPDRPTLIKLYGDAGQPDTLVVTDRDHSDLLRDRDREPLVDEVRRAFRRNTVLFLGYNLADPDFRFLFDQVAESRFARTAYAVWPGLPDVDVKMWRDRGGVILDTDPFGILSEDMAQPIPGGRPEAITPVAVSPSLSDGTKGDDAPNGLEALYGVGHRWAVLIGVNEYEDKANYGQLHVCVKDVEAIREQLIVGGFAPDRVRLLTDQTAEIPTRANILTALIAVADATERDDLLLIYYSGHGDFARGESYLIARDGRRLVLGDTAVPVSRIKEIVEEAPARAKVIILDACHSGADIGGKGPKPMSDEFIRRVFEQAEGFAILSSCKQGQLSYEWRENERSVFSHFLLEALAGPADQDEKGFVTVQDANRHVTNGVKLWASQHNTSQTPTLQYTVAGDIIMTRLGPGSSS
jgi:hypothetical protein